MGIFRGGRRWRFWLVVLGRGVFLGILLFILLFLGVGFFVYLGLGWVVFIRTCFGGRRRLGRRVFFGLGG